MSNHILQKRKVVQSKINPRQTWFTSPELQSCVGIKRAVSCFLMYNQKKVIPEAWMYSKYLGLNIYHNELPAVRWKSMLSKNPRLSVWFWLQRKTDPFSSEWGENKISEGDSGQDHSSMFLFWLSCCEGKHSKCVKCLRTAKSVKCCGGGVENTWEWCEEYGRPHTKKHSCKPVCTSAEKHTRTDRHVKVIKHR